MNNMNLFDNRQHNNNYQDYSEQNKENINYSNLIMENNQMSFRPHVGKEKMIGDPCSKVALNYTKKIFNYNNNLMETINRKYLETSQNVKNFLNCQKSETINSYNPTYTNWTNSTNCTSSTNTYNGTLHYPYDKENNFAVSQSDISSETNTQDSSIDLRGKRSVLMELASQCNLPEENPALYLPLFSKFSKEIPHEYLLDIWESLKAEESTNTVNYYYMLEQKDINEKMRAILIDWIVDVHGKFKLAAETLFLTVNIIDRFLSHKPILRSKLQLIGVSALMIACKYEEILCPDLRDFVYVTDKTYSKQEIIQTEKEILLALQFNVTVPTSLRFFEIISLNFNFNEIEFAFGKYLLEMFLIDCKMSKYPSSLIALSSAYIIMKMNNYSNYKDLYDLFNLTVCNQCVSNSKMLKECAKELYFLTQNAKSFTKLQAVYNKFSTKEYHRVAILGMGVYCVKRD